MIASQTAISCHRLCWPHLAVSIMQQSDDCLSVHIFLVKLSICVCVCARVLTDLGAATDVGVINGHHGEIPRQQVD